MKTITSFLRFFIILMLFAGCNSGTNFYVSNSGNDSNPGTRDKPFRTIQKAKNAVREIVPSHRGSEISVWLGTGTYHLEEPFVLGPEDSGPDEGVVIYRALAGERVEFSGGIEIIGWKKRKVGYWVAPLNSLKAGNVDFRELFINGERAIRARYPNNGYLRVAEVGTDKRTNFRFTKNDFPLPGNPTEVELVLLHGWSITRINLSGIDTTNRIITAIDSIGAKCLDFFHLDRWSKNPRYFLENSLAFLDTDKEWFFDKHEGLFYLKLPENETPVGKSVIVPYVSNNLLRLTGKETQKIKNIRFENINFNYCSWSLPVKGYAGIQACHFDPRSDTHTSSWDIVPSAVETVWADNCSFINCRFSHLGGSGLWIGAGTVNCLVSDCQFEDISGNGIMIGEGNDRKVEGEFWWKKVPGQAAAGNKVENSLVTTCGRQFFGAVGIWCGLTANTSILNNHIYDLPYTGLSVGWLWSPDSTPCRENRLEGNHIHHVLQTLGDGGGIYMLGLQPGSRIVNNHIHDVPSGIGGDSNGIFLDEGATDVEIRGNLIYYTANSPVRFHAAKRNMVKDNIMGCGDGIPPVSYGRTPLENITFENNQILLENDPGNWKILEATIARWKNKHN